MLWKGRKRGGWNRKTGTEEKERGNRRARVWYGEEGNEEYGIGKLEQRKREDYWNGRYYEREEQRGVGNRRTGAEGKGRCYGKEEQGEDGIGKLEQRERGENTRMGGILRKGRAK